MIRGVTAVFVNGPSRRTPPAAAKEKPRQFQRGFSGPNKPAAVGGMGPASATTQRTVM
jgi:hypothetical protein